MKSTLRPTLLACAAITLVLASSAEAGTTSVSSRQVRAAQMQLADLGYDTGRKDGVLGAQTSGALMDFQSRSGLPVTGMLDPTTAQFLAQVDATARNDYYAANGYVAPRIYNNYGASNIAYAPAYPAVAPGYTTADAYGRVTMIAPVAYDTVRSVNVQAVPIRFGNLAVNEDHRGMLRQYSITLNGQPVLFANNQSIPLRISKTYTMQGEDAVIFTAHDGTNGCSYKNYLLTIRSDGSYNAPQEIGNCSGAYQARVDGNSLFVSFPRDQYASNATQWNTWRYGENRLARI